MAEREDFRALTDPNARAEEDLGLHPHVGAELRVPGEPGRGRVNEARARIHHLRPQAVLDRSLAGSELAPGIDAHQLGRRALGPGDLVPVDIRDGHGIGEHPFPRGVVGSDLAEAFRQDRRIGHENAGIAEI